MNKSELHKFITEHIARIVSPADSKIFAREYKIMKKLMSQYSNNNIWINMDIKLPSLAFFLTEKGKEMIKKVENQINFDIVKKEEVKLSENKFGEDKKFNQILSLKDFLQKY